MNQWVRSILSIFGGYATIVLGTSLIFSLLPNEGSYLRSGSIEMVVAGILVFTCALTAGYITRRISQNKPVVHSLVIVFFIILETVWIISGQRSDAPVWFDILAGMNLVTGILTGASFPLLKRKIAWRL